jgi:hypothetical protein
MALCSLAVAGACAGQNVTASYPEVTAGSVPDPDASTTTSRGTTSRGGTSRGTSTTRSGATTTRSGTPSTKKPINPVYKSYCDAFLSKISAAFKGTDEDEQLVRTKDALADLAEIAPAPIQADMETFSDYVQTVTDPDDMKASNQPAAVKAADDRLDDWHTENCGV